MGYEVFLATLNPTFAARGWQEINEIFPTHILANVQFCSTARAHLCVMVVLAPLGVLFRSLPPSRLQIGGSKPASSTKDAETLLWAIIAATEQGRERRGESFSLRNYHRFWGLGKTGDIQGFWLSEAGLCECKQITKLSGRTERPLSANAERERGLASHILRGLGWVNNVGPVNLRASAIINVLVPVW